MTATAKSAQSERARLEWTIAAREAHRAVLGGSAADAAIAALRRELAAVEMFVLPAPNAITSLSLYVVAILAGTLVPTGMLFLHKRPANANQFWVNRAMSHRPNLDSRTSTRWPLGQ